MHTVWRPLPSTGTSSIPTDSACSACNGLARLRTHTSISPHQGGQQEAQRELDALFTTEKKEDAEEPDLDMLIQGGAPETKGSKNKMKKVVTPKSEAQQQIEQTEINKFDQELDRAYYNNANV